MPLHALFRLAFAPAPGPHALNLDATPSNSPAHSSIGTPSQHMAAPTARGRTVSGSLHPPPGVLFTFPSRYCSLSVVEGIEPWRVVPPASRGIPRAPRYSGAQPAAPVAFRLRDCHPLRSAVPGRSARRRSPTPPRGSRPSPLGPTTPRQQRPRAWHWQGLGWSAFAHHY